MIRPHQLSPHRNLDRADNLIVISNEFSAIFVFLYVD